MKLFTEEQVKQIVEKSRATGLTAEYLMLITTPIKLPTNEEIETNAEYFSNNQSIYDAAKDDTLYGFREGAKWMRDKIQGGNKI